MVLAQKKLLISADSCLILHERFQKYLLLRIQNLNPFLMLAFKIMNQFEPPFALKLSKKSLKELNENFHLIKNCFQKNMFVAEDCVPLCEKFSLTSLSSTFFGEFSFYQNFNDLFQQFSTWIIKEKELRKAKEEPNERILQALKRIQNASRRFKASSSKAQLYKSNLIEQ